MRYARGHVWRRCGARERAHVRVECATGVAVTTGDLDWSEPALHCAGALHPLMERETHEREAAAPRDAQLAGRCAQRREPSRERQRELSTRCIPRPARECCGLTHAFFHSAFAARA